MKNLMVGLVVLIGSALTLTPGCGDDNADETGGGSGGAAGKGGSSGKGGSQASAGDTGDAGAGNASSGGETGSGGTPAEGGETGSGGTPAEGGAGGAGFMNPEGCPEAAPETGEDCTVDLEMQSACEYPGSSCVCNGFLGGGGAGGAMAGTFICRGAGADCPEATPMTDEMCTDNGTHCPYPGSIDCFCAAANWDCEGPDLPGQGGVGGGGPGPGGECPELEPGNTDECDGPIRNCLYAESDTVCHCPSNGPDANEWSCQSP